MQVSLQTPTSRRVPPWTKIPFIQRSTIASNYCSHNNKLRFDTPESGSLSKPLQKPPIPLPIVIHKKGKSSRYFWNGTSLQLINLDASSSLSNHGFNYSNICNQLCQVLTSLFIPVRVPENYVVYVKWKFVHRVASSALQVLATQSMFRAIGIGYSRGFASAAALNWLFKDGLGRLFRCVYTASLASSFDTNLKRVRFSTSLLFTVSIGLELLTQVFPKYFLLLASIANIAKQISLASYLATNSAVHQSFAMADNLGEVSAKSQIQTVTFDNLGLLLAALLNFLCKNNERLQGGLPLVAFPIFAAVDLFGIFQGLKHVHLRTLTKDRLEILINTWIQLGYVLSVSEVSEIEGFDFWGIRGVPGTKPWPVRIGVLDSAEQSSSMLSMLAMDSLSNKDFYLICMENLYTGFKRSHNHGIVISFRDGASTRDLILGTLQACYLRKRLLFCYHENKNGESYTEEISQSKWLGFLNDSKQCAEADVDLLIEQMTVIGWSVKSILLSAAERARYSFIDH